MTNSSLKKEAKAVLQHLPGKIGLYALPIILTVFQFGIQVHERYLLEKGITLDPLASFFPILLRIIVTFLFLSASFALLAALRGQKDRVTFNDGTLAFTRPYFGKAFFLYLIRSFLITLWSIPFSIGLMMLVWGSIAYQNGGSADSPILILGIGLVCTIIGGIIAFNRQIAYSLAEYIMFDHIKKDDYTGSMECIGESVALIKGYKWQLFKLQLSFLGWFLLTILSFGILSFYVVPYFTMSNLCFYEMLRKDNEAKIAATELTEMN